MQYRKPQQVFPEDLELYTSSDDRPNTGLREGAIAHSEVNNTIRANPKTVIFGQQTRLRNGTLLPDERLLRFHAGHDIVKFFYSAIRQLPPYLIDALLDNNVSVTLVQGPSLLVFLHSREHFSQDAEHLQLLCSLAENMPWTTAALPEAIEDFQLALEQQLDLSNALKGLQAQQSKHLPHMRAPGVHMPLATPRLLVFEDTGALSVAETKTTSITQQRKLARDLCYAWL